jgi:hypothetical protein
VLADINTIKIIRMWLTINNQVLNYKIFNKLIKPTERES